LLSPSWLTHSGRLTHEVVTRQPCTRRRLGKVRQTDVLTTERRRQPKTVIARYICIFKTNFTEIELTHIQRRPIIDWAKSTVAYPPKILGGHGPPGLAYSAPPMNSTARKEAVTSHPFGYSARPPPFLAPPTNNLIQMPHWLTLCTVSLETALDDAVWTA